MATEKQIRANRINSLRGGVKTAEGKAAVRLNAVSHGFFSKDVVLPGEDQRLLIDLRESLTAEVKPVGEMETLLLEMIISASWRIRRILNYEQKNARSAIDYRYSINDKIIHYIQTLQRQVYRAMHELERLQSARIKAAGPAPGTGSIVSAISSPDNPTEK